MIKVRITTPYRTILTEAVHVDVALYGKDDKIQIMVTMGVYFYEAHIVALDETAVVNMVMVYRWIKAKLREEDQYVAICLNENESLELGTIEVARAGPGHGRYSVTVGKTETQVAAA